MVEEMAIVTVIYSRQEWDRKKAVEGKKGGFTLHARVHVVYLWVRSGGFGGFDRFSGFGSARFWLNVGHVGFSYVVSHYFWGGFRFGVEDIVGSGFRSLFGGEVAEFILCRYDGGVFGVGRMVGDKVIPVENGVGNSCRTRTLFAFRV